MVQNNLQNRNRVTDGENSVMIRGGGGGREGQTGIEKDTYYISNKYCSIQYSTGNVTQYSGLGLYRKESKKRLDICIPNSLCCAPETNTTV